MLREILLRNSGPLHWRYVKGAEGHPCEVLQSFSYKRQSEKEMREVPLVVVGVFIECRARGRTEQRGVSQNAENHGEECRAKRDTDTNVWKTH